MDAAEAASPDRVKVARAINGDALYFSRAPIPYTRDTLPQDAFLLHLGLYAFRMETLALFTTLPQSPLEQREKLEQLRLLENGNPMRVSLTPHKSHGVDTPEDINSLLPLVREAML